MIVGVWVWAKICAERKKKHRKLNSRLDMLRKYVFFSKFELCFPNIDDNVYIQLDKNFCAQIFPLKNIFSVFLFRTRHFAWVSHIGPIEFSLSCILKILNGMCIRVKHRIH